MAARGRDPPRPRGRPPPPRAGGRALPPGTGAAPTSPPTRGPEPLERWALGLDAPPDYRWWEVAAGASSSVAAHALIAAAAEPGTTAADRRADRRRLPAADRRPDRLPRRPRRPRRDRAAGEHNYLAYYASPEEAADRLALIASRAEALSARLPHPGRHRAILAGVAGFYLSAAAAQTPYAQPIRARLLASLGPGARLLAAFMRLRRLRERKWPGRAGKRARAMSLRWVLAAQGERDDPHLAPVPSPIGETGDRRSIRTDTDRFVKPSGLLGHSVGPFLRLAETEVGQQRQQHELWPQLFEAVETADPQVVADEPHHPRHQGLVRGPGKPLSDRGTDP